MSLSLSCPDNWLSLMWLFSLWPGKRRLFFPVTTLHTSRLGDGSAVALVLHCHFQMILLKSLKLLWFLLPTNTWSSLLIFQQFSLVADFNFLPYHPYLNSWPFKCVCRWMILPIVSQFLLLLHDLAFQLQWTNSSLTPGMCCSVVWGLCVLFSPIFGCLRSPVYLFF